MARRSRSCRDVHGCRRERDPSSGPLRGGRWRKRRVRHAGQGRAPERARRGVLPPRRATRSPPRRLPAARFPARRTRRPRVDPMRVRTARQRASRSRARRLTSMPAVAAGRRRSARPPPAAARDEAAQSRASAVRAPTFDRGDSILLRTGQSTVSKNVRSSRAPAAWARRRGMVGRDGCAVAERTIPSRLREQRSLGRATARACWRSPIGSAASPSTSQSLFLAVYLVSVKTLERVLDRHFTTRSRRRFRSMPWPVPSKRRCGADRRAAARLGVVRARRSARVVLVFGADGRTPLVGGRRFARPDPAVSIRQLAFGRAPVAGDVRGDGFSAAWHSPRTRSSSPERAARRALGAAALARRERTARRRDLAREVTARRVLIERELDAVRGRLEVEPTENCSRKRSASCFALAPRCAKLDALRHANASCARRPANRPNSCGTPHSKDARRRCATSRHDDEIRKLEPSCDARQKTGSPTGRARETEHLGRHSARAHKSRWTTVRSTISWHCAMRTCSWPKKR